VLSYRKGPFNDALSNSLKTIRAAKTQFHLLTARGSTQAVLTSQIELCDVLLKEIRSISCSLEKRMRGGSATNRCCAATRRTRSCRHLAVPQRRKLALRPREHKPGAAKRDKEDVT
jgi:hypothetical protein